MNNQRFRNKEEYVAYLNSYTVPDVVYAFIPSLFLFLQLVACLIVVMIFARMKRVSNFPRRAALFHVLSFVISVSCVVVAIRTLLSYPIQYSPENRNYFYTQKQFVEFAQTFGLKLCYACLWYLVAYLIADLVSPRSSVSRWWIHLISVLCAVIPLINVLVFFERNYPIRVKTPALFAFVFPGNAAITSMTFLAIYKSGHKKFTVFCGPQQLLGMIVLYCMGAMTMFPAFFLWKRAFLFGIQKNCFFLGFLSVFVAQSLSFCDSIVYCFRQSSTSTSMSTLTSTSTLRSWLVRVLTSTGVLLLVVSSLGVKVEMQISGYTAAVRAARKS